MLEGSQCAIFGCFCNRHCFALGFSLRDVLLNNFSVLTQNKEDITTIFVWLKICTLLFYVFTICTVNVLEISTSSSALALSHSF